MNDQISKQPVDMREIYSVSTLNRHLKQAIAGQFSLVWVEGEISNLARPASGHIYFSLKDKQSQIRCVMFRSSVKRTAFEVSSGLHVVVRASASVYEARGDLQLIVDSMEEAGFGALQRQFEALKKKLFQEGLFDQDRKKPIPSYPREIAIITSPSGAAIKDYLHVAQRRYPSCKISVYSVPVQGEQASDHIVRAIQAVNRHARADVIVIIRGGGSIEDLWCFNNEPLARIIAKSAIPIVSGIGHEIDYTIADFVADLRAPTPSVAAELTCPDTDALNASLVHWQQVLRRLAMERIYKLSQSTDWLSQRLQRTHPLTVVSTQKQSLASLLARLQRSTMSQLKNSQYRLDSIQQRHTYQSPVLTIKAHSAEVEKLSRRLTQAIHRQLEQRHHQFQLCAKTMQTVSPLNTLQRGYSITLSQPEEQIIINPDVLKAGDQITTYLAKGEIISTVRSTSSRKITEKFPNQESQDH